MKGSNLKCGSRRTKMNQVDEHEHEFSASDWPFSDPTNSVSISTRQVVREGQPVLRVSHDLDGDWQVLCETTTHDRSMSFPIGPLRTSHSP
jgi:hypothetical protein